MTSNKVFCTIVSCVLVLGACSSGEMESNGTASDESGLLGGAILKSPIGVVPDDLYMETGILLTDEFKPFTKKLTVYGLTLIGREDISDDFMRQVAKTIKEIFPRDDSMDSAMQEDLIRNMYERNAVIPFFLGENFDMSPEDEAAFDITRNRNSVCDIIMKDVPGQVMEVVEHILHYVNDTGLHFSYPERWGVTKDSQFYQMMLEASEKGFYDYGSYDDIKDEETRIRVALQEFGYWIISTAWNLQEPYVPRETSEWTIRNAADMQEKFPAVYQLYEETVATIMVAPSIETFEEFVN